MTRTSSSNVFLNSFEARRNSERPLPKDFPSSGSLRGPKTSKATTKMIINSGTPIGPITSSTLYVNHIGSIGTSQDRVKTKKSWLNFYLPEERMSFLQLDRYPYNLLNLSHAY